jgi:hypothetical protein
MCIDNACQPIPPQQLPYEENLQLASPPELPTHWSSNNMKGDLSVMWTVAVDGTDHSFYIQNFASETDISLVSPKIVITSSNTIVTFQHSFQFDVNDEFGQPFFDGGIVEVSVNEMVYENIEKVGSFISGAYNGIIQGWENNLSDQNGFVEKSNGKITSAIKLSPDLKDSVIQLRFRIGTDISGGDLGWNISSISVAVMLPKPAPTMPKPMPTVPKPAPTVPKPMPTVPQPAPIVPKPMPTVPKPAPTVPKPMPTVPKPAPIVPKPMPTLPQPAPIVPKPMPTVPKPAPTMPKPMPTVPKPAPIVPKPMPTVPKPAPIVPKPMPTGTKFVPTVPKPMPTGTKIVPTVPKPIPTGTKIVPTVPKPIPTVPKPVPTVLKPVPNAPKPVPILPNPMPTGPTRTLPNPKKPAVS